MKIACPECQAAYEVALPPLGDRGIELRCAVCHHRFRIKRKAGKAPGESPAAASPETTAGISSLVPEEPEEMAPPAETAAPQSVEGVADGDVPEMLEADDEPPDIELPEEITAAGEPTPVDANAKDWEKISDSSRALEEQELEEAARYAEEFAHHSESAPEETDIPQETPQSAEEQLGDLIDPEIWMGTMEEMPAPEAGLQDPASEDAPHSEPFEDPEMWAEAFADHAAREPERAGEPADAQTGVEDGTDPGSADAWAEMFAAQAGEEPSLDAVMEENPTAGQIPEEPQEPEEVPPEPEEVPTSPEPEEVPAPEPPQEVPPPPPETPPQPSGSAAVGGEDDPGTREKKWEALEAQLTKLEAQREQLKKKSSDAKLKELEEQRLQLELERQRLKGESYTEDEDEPGEAPQAGTPPAEPEAVEEPTAPAHPLTASADTPESEGTPSEESAREPVVSEPAAETDVPEIPDEELDVVGFDEELADHEKEVIGLDEELARAGAPLPIEATGAGEDEEEPPEAMAGNEAAPAPEREEPATAVSWKEESPEKEKRKKTETSTPATAGEPKRAYSQPGLTALEDLSGDLFNGTAPQDEEGSQSAMYDFVGDSRLAAGAGGDIQEPPAGAGEAFGAEGGEPDDFTATFFSQSGQPDTQATGEQDAERNLPSGPASDWVQSLDEDDEALTKEEMWEREFPGLSTEEEEELATPAAQAVDDDPFSEAADDEAGGPDMYEEYDDDEEDEGARPIVVGSEYEDTGFEEEGFEGVDASAYEDFDDDEDYELAFNKPRTFGPFAIPHGSKGNWIVGSVVVGLLLMLGTAYFVMKTFSPDELKDFMVADSEVPEGLVPQEGQTGPTPPPTTAPEAKELLKESDQEQALDIDELMGETQPVPPEPETQKETVAEETVPQTEPGESIQEEAARLLEPSEDNELLKELQQSEVLQESQKEMDEAIEQEEKLAEFIDPNASIVAFNTILPVAYNTTDIRVLSFRLELEMNSPDAADVVRKAMPVYEDMLMSAVEGFFQQRFYTDVVYAKERLRDKLTAEFNKSIENGEIKKANFTDFAIQ